VKLFSPEALVLDQNLSRGFPRTIQPWSGEEVGIKDEREMRDGKRKRNERRGLGEKKEGSCAPQKIRKSALMLVG